MTFQHEFNREVLLEPVGGVGEELVRRRYGRRRRSSLVRCFLSGEVITTSEAMQWRRMITIMSHTAHAIGLFDDQHSSSRHPRNYSRKR